MGQFQFPDGSELLVLPGKLLTHLLILFLRIRAKILGLEDLSDLELPFRAGGIGAALRPADRLGQRAALPDPKARDELLGFGEGPIHDRSLLTREENPRALGTGL